MPANHIVAGMARSYKMALPPGERHDKCKSQSACAFSINTIGQLRFFRLIKNWNHRPCFRCPSIPTARRNRP